jgi:hypothetical protein
MHGLLHRAPGTGDEKWVAIVLDEDPFKGNTTSTDPLLALENVDQRDDLMPSS